MFNPARYQVVSFDCYGTLVDWETGLLGTLRPLLARHGVKASDEEVLELYARLESTLQAGPYLPYREVLKHVSLQLGAHFNFPLSIPDAQGLAASLAGWPPFPDAAALKHLKSRYRLALLTNADDDLLAPALARFEVLFDWVITSQQAGAYKPAPRFFQHAMGKIGFPVNQILHVSASLYHDIGPVAALGMDTIWVNRRANKEGSGATPPSAAHADLTMAGLQELVDAVDDESWRTG
jgi:2-haloacid dehalogenase